MNVFRQIKRFISGERLCDACERLRKTKNVKITATMELNGVSTVMHKELCEECFGRTVEALENAQENMPYGVGYEVE